MNPIPVMVWTAQHDSTLLPKSLDDAERIADELLGQETENPNSVYLAFAANMLAWMEENHIPLLGALASLHNDLLNTSVNKRVRLYFEDFPRDNGVVYEQFLRVARAYQLVVYDTTFPTAVFLPNGSSMPFSAQRQVALRARTQLVSQQQRKMSDTPIRFEQVPEWLKIQVNAHFSGYGFSECVVQVSEDNSIMAKCWKKTSAGLMTLLFSVYERHGELRMSAYLSVHLFDLFVIKNTLSDGQYSNKSQKYLSQDFDFRFSMRNSPELEVFFKKLIERFKGYIESFSDILSFYNYACKNIQQDAPNTIDMHFFVRACMILSPENIKKIKSLVLENEHFDEQCQLMLAYNIPTVTAAPAFYADDLGMEDSVIEGFKLLYT